MAKNYSGICPVCGAINIKYGNTEITGECIVQEATCNECGSEFDEWYEITYLETITLNKGE